VFEHHAPQTAETLRGCPFEFAQSIDQARSISIGDIVFSCKIIARRNPRRDALD
jgi:hypothetical protein